MSNTLMVVGVERAEAHPERMKALLLALLTKEGLQLLEGKLTAGFSGASREAWLLWAEDNLLREEGAILWVDPFEEQRVIAADIDLQLQKGESLVYSASLKEWVYVRNTIKGSLPKKSNWWKKSRKISQEASKDMQKDSQWLLGEINEE